MKRSVFTCRHCGAPLMKEVGRQPTNAVYCSDKCRFLSKVHKEDMADPMACWRWNGAKHGKGYGHFKVGAQAQKAHRSAYELFCGPIPDGLLACHSCDNPACVNPRHLFLGTNEENLADRQAKGRQARGETHSRAILTEAQVRIIRSGALTDDDAAQQFGVSPSAIRSARKGESWRHI